MSAGAGSKWDQLGISGTLASELRRMEDARLDWLKHLQPYSSIAEEVHKINKATNSALYVGQLAALQDAKQLLDQQDYFKRMLDPIADIRKQYAFDPNWQRMIDIATKPAWLSDELTRTFKAAGQVGAFSAMDEGIQASLRHAREVLAATSASGQITRLMKSYQDAHQHWEVPRGLVESVGAIKVLQESVGRLTIPVIDWSSAATLAGLLGERGIEAQLVALGIRADGTLLEVTEETAEQENGIGLSRKAMELMALISFIAVFLIPYLQELSSGKWQGKTDSELALQRQSLEKQQNQLEALSNLVLIAIEKETKRANDRFVVLDRVATVRSDPENRSLIVSKLFPREVVKPLAEQGKWIQIEYYDWLRQQYHSGWALKKYFKRVPTTYAHSGQQEDEELRRLAEVRLNDGQQPIKVKLNDL
ncbi:hypothetical protein [Candidatus Nitrotoga arctica]|uniref:SH3 domain-containing protein n=1 Tax=Candidatus Nitrotoga arctica TaxID=453162 RepID=A0ABN8AT21_9PROT|nr:hypothetical protein [Candidatus Nitrotoga arctica]CAG9933761.1 conserved protein of unknown function [Candidatus Nitrotoga arctica]